MRKKIISLIVVGLFAGVCFFVLAQSASAEVISGGGLVPCGKSGQPMCTLCDLIKGFDTIIKYIMRIAVVVFLAAFTIGGGMYVISVGDSKMIDKAKGAMKNAAIGLAVILLAWLMINTLLFVIGTKSNVNSSWGNFQCAAGAKSNL